MFSNLWLSDANPVSVKNSMPQRQRIAAFFMKFLPTLRTNIDN